MTDTLFLAPSFKVIEKTRGETNAISPFMESILISVIVRVPLQVKGIIKDCQWRAVTGKLSSCYWQGFARHLTTSVFPAEKNQEVKSIYVESDYEFCSKFSRMDD